ncbi:MAG: ribosome biogenesis GTPase YqeH [Candidatus Hepatoplasma vulgare]|nr:MAG: ribosome biogenesis GTPase YqeH [Candidatus Hepatoplasma sp.]
MNYKKYCLGCGEILQIENKNSDGYTPDINLKFCKSCFQNKNYGIINDNKTFLNIEKTLIKIKQKKLNVILIIDILNPFETLLKNINNYVNKKNIILIVNKRDIFPKSISDLKIKKWIEKIALKANFSFKKIFIISSLKHKNIDNVFEFFDSFKFKEFAVIGYSNVGKSHFLNSLFASKKVKIENLISNSLSTTKKEIKLNLKNLIFYDYPGFFLEGNYLNLIKNLEFKKISPQKEIKVINYNLKDSQLVKIDNYAFLAINNLKEFNNFQFIFSNNLKISRHKFDKNIIDKKFKNIIFNNLKSYEKYDLIISGLGIITFKKLSNDLTLFLPENVKYNLLESIFS